MSMKHRFMEHYREARRSSDSLPKVLVKAGHWHTFRGMYQQHVPTFGNFVSELATSNGLGSFVLSTHVVDSPEEWRNTRNALARFSGSPTPLVVDLRALRPLVHQGTVDEMEDGFADLVFRADAALVIPGGTTGAYTAAR